MIQLSVRTKNCFGKWLRKILSGYFDKSTWEGVSDYTPIIDVVHKRIAIHPIHQQQCELHVQMAAFVASTNVGEVRRSCRAMCLSTIFRPYHQWALKIYQMKRDEENAKLFAAGDKLKKKQVVRVSGSLRMQTLADYADKFTERAEDILGQLYLMKSTKRSTILSAQQRARQARN